MNRGINEKLRVFLFVYFLCKIVFLNKLFLIDKIYV